MPRDAFSPTDIFLIGINCRLQQDAMYYNILTLLNFFTLIICEIITSGYNLII